MLAAMLCERNFSLPFILITGHDAPGLRQKAIECGAAAYLAKPFRGTALLAAVREAISTPPAETTTTADPRSQMQASR